MWKREARVAQPPLHSVIASPEDVAAVALGLVCHFYAGLGHEVGISDGVSDWCSATCANRTTVLRGPRPRP
ncbi:hypothetical protein GCM10010244_56270 [Streptomyces coeruleorubidus]|nr:hypothetical protein GCM10010244_56270 [Streptomyces bellus]